MTESLRAWARKAIGPSRYEFVLKMTLLYVILHSRKLFLPQTAAFLPVAGTILAANMLLFPALLRNGLLWLALSIMSAVALVTSWDVVDNHFYLTTYWLAACTISAFLGSSLSVLSLNARYLVGLSFLFASIWKFQSGYWTDGSFVYFLSIFDLRVQYLLGRLVGSAELSAVREQFEVVSFLPALARDISLPTVTSMYWLSKLMTYTALALEMALAVLFLLRRPRFLMPFRDVFLIAFAIGAYVMAPVYGFAYVFSIFGLAHCGEERRTSQLLYVGLFVFAVTLSQAAPRGIGEWIGRLAS